MQTRLILVLALICATACSLGTGGRQPVMPSADNRMDPAHAPTPYSAAEIRGYCKGGRTYRFGVESQGKPIVIQTMKFAKGTEEQAVFVMSFADEKGQPMGEPRESRARWEELQSHASFPADDTLILQDEVQTRAGTHACWIYRVDAKNEGSRIETIYSFAKDMPGPPVLMERRVDKKLTMRMELHSTSTTDSDG